MIEKFAIMGCTGSSEFLDLNHTSYDSSVPYDSEVRSDSSIELWRTSESGH